MEKTGEKKNTAFYDIEYIKQIPVSQVLDDYGIAVKKGMFSVRNERTPSCKIYPDTNSWADFGGAAVRGGSPIDLVRAIGGVDFKEAIQILGERYNAPLLRGQKQDSHNKVIGNAQYALIGIVGNPVFKNILKPEYAESLTYETIQHCREQYNITMNQLFRSDPGTYTAILKSEALPFMKRFQNEYLVSLHTLESTGRQFEHNSNEIQYARFNAQEAFKDYLAAYKVLQAAAKNTELEIRGLRPDYASDYAAIGKKSIEIGAYPYADLKLSGPLHHMGIPYGDFLVLNDAVYDDDLDVPPFSAHLKGDTVTLSCRAQDENMFRGITDSIAAMASMDKAPKAPHQPGHDHDFEMEL